VTGGLVTTVVVVELVVVVVAVVVVVDVVVVVSDAPARDTIDVSTTSAVASGKSVSRRCICSPMVPQQLTTSPAFM
jgi:hypothetical protein